MTQTTQTVFASDLLDGKQALVTGASRGIGAAIADALADAGAKVIGTATSGEGAEAIGERLGERGEGRVLDVASAESVDALVAGLGKEVPEILVNNAGIARDNLLLRMKPEEWDAVIETNLTGVFRLCRGLARGMMRRRAGRILNIASVIGVMGNAGQTNYAAAKAGIIGFSKSLAREIGSRGITVNVIAPGFIDTDMTRALGEGERESLLAQVPLGRLGTTADVAAAAVFLASGAGGYITGETLHVNGGMWMV